MLKDLLNKYIKGLTKTELKFFLNIGEMLPGPTPLCKSNNIMYVILC